MQDKKRTAASIGCILLWLTIIVSGIIRIRETRALSYMSQQELEAAILSKQSILVYSMDDMPDTYTSLWVVPKYRAKDMKSRLSNFETMQCVFVVEEYKDADAIARVLSCVSQRREIQRIIIEDINMQNFNALSHMENLEVLHYNNYGNRNSDENEVSLSFDGTFPALKELEIQYTKLPSLGDIAKMKGLEEADFSSTDVSDITALGPLTNIEVLNLSRTKVHDIKALSDMSGMRELYLDFAFVSDISPLSDMEGLEVLSVMQDYYHDKDMEQYLIQDITPLSGKQALRELILYGSMVRDISPLKDCLALEELELSYTPLESPDTLRYLPALQHVGIYHCDDLFGGDWDKSNAWFEKYGGNFRVN